MGRGAVEFPADLAPGWIQSIDRGVLQVQEQNPVALTHPDATRVPKRAHESIGQWHIKFPYGEIQSVIVILNEA